MLKRLHSLFLFGSRLSYAMPVTAILVITFLLVYQDREISVGDAVILVLVAAALALIWQVFHSRFTEGLPDDPTALLKTLNNTNYYTLLAFESEYCAACMTNSPQVNKLEDLQSEGFKVIRLSVNREPGRSLFQKYNCRLSPTYLLIDQQGNVIQDWPLVLPISRIMYTVNNPPRAA